MIPGPGGTQRLARLVGLGRAKDIIMRGRRVKAPEALELVTEVVAAATLDDAVASLVEELSRHSPLAMRMARRVLNTAYDAPMHAGLELGPRLRAAAADPRLPRGGRGVRREAEAAVHRRVAFPRPGSPKRSRRIDSAVRMDVRRRHNIRELGRPAGRSMIFAHGFGCDQSMWDEVAPAFSSAWRVVLFDHVGAGGSDLSSYDLKKYGTLDGYARDVIEICKTLALESTVFVGHSVSAMIGVLAARHEPELFEKLVLVGPSPRYTNDGDYVGGFSDSDIDELLSSLDDNYLGWSSAMAPVIMGNDDRPELGRRLTESFCQTDPAIARRFARVTFHSDNRDDLPHVPVPTLILQCSNDPIAPLHVGEYVTARIPDSTMVVLEATGHCPNVSAPAATVAAIRAFL